MVRSAGVADYHELVGEADDLRDLGETVASLRSVTSILRPLMLLGSLDEAQEQAIKELVACQLAEAIAATHDEYYLAY